MDIQTGTRWLYTRGYLGITRLGERVYPAGIRVCLYRGEALDARIIVFSYYQGIFLY